MSARVIVNNQFTNKLADLSFGFPKGPVGGNEKIAPPAKGEAAQPNTQTWEVTSLDAAGRITIQNVQTKAYAFVYGEADGIPVTGSDQKFEWKLIAVAGEPDLIGTLSGNFVWYLENDKNCTILLKPTTAVVDDKKAQWNIRSA